MSAAAGTFRAFCLDLLVAPLAPLSHLCQILAEVMEGGDGLFLLAGVAGLRHLGSPLPLQPGHILEPLVGR